MKKQLIFITFLMSLIVNGQVLENCLKCTSVKYTISDIKKNKLFEIVLLRNEIFARHNYTFKNERLSTYYLQYDWYTPNYKNPIKYVKLNAIEEHNSNLFKLKEGEIKKNRKRLINELVNLKRAIKEENNDFIKTTFNGVINTTEDTFYNTIVEAISDVFNAIDIEDINWHKGKAQYQILIDNGFSVSSKGIYIEGNSITIMSSNPMKHSSLMDQDDAFEYPSDYFSESESTIGAEFAFKEGKLILIKPFFAG